MTMMIYLEVFLPSRKKVDGVTSCVRPLLDVSQITSVKVGQESAVEGQLVIGAMDNCCSTIKKLLTDWCKK